MNCTWENCTQEAERPLIMSHKGPVLARLCLSHYQEFMDAPRNCDALTTGIESVVVKLKKAIHSMPA